MRHFLSSTILTVVIPLLACFSSQAQTLVVEGVKLAMVESFNLGPPMEGAVRAPSSVIGADDLRALGFRNFYCSATSSGGISRDINRYLLAANETEAIKTFLVSEKIYTSNYQGKTSLRAAGNGDGQDAFLKEITCKLAD